jgi:putative GTP pyrophosphokinase
MKSSKILDTINRIKKDLPRYKKLTPAVFKVLKSALADKQIHHVLVEKRTKKLVGILEKIKRNGYSDPQVLKKLKCRYPEELVTDISGLRVVVHLDSQVRPVSKLIGDIFRIDVKNIRKPDKELSVNQVGYRCLHYTCEFKNARNGVSEYADLSGLKFEIQLRTVLQHAWAELDHDSRYKFSVELPKKLQREMFLYAGLLEIADNGFGSLANKISNYQKKIEKNTGLKQYNAELNSISLESFIVSWCKEFSYRLRPLKAPEASSVLVIELKDFGLKTIGDLKKIIPESYGMLSKRLKLETNIYGLVREWMILNNFEKYRDFSWKKKWYSLADDGDEKRQFSLYSEIVGKDKAKSIFETFTLKS